MFKIYFNKFYKYQYYNYFEHYLYLSMCMLCHFMLINDHWNWILSGSYITSTYGKLNVRKGEQKILSHKNTLVWRHVKQFFVCVIYVSSADRTSNVDSCIVTKTHNSRCFQVTSVRNKQWGTRLATLCPTSKIRRDVIRVWLHASLRIALKRAFLCTTRAFYGNSPLRNDITSNLEVGHSVGRRVQVLSIFSTFLL